MNHLKIHGVFKSILMECFRIMKEFKAVLKSIKSIKTRKIHHHIINLMNLIVSFRNKNLN